MFVILVLPQWRVDHEFVEHVCTVVDKRPKQERREDGTIAPPGVQIKYQIGVETHRPWIYDVRNTYSGEQDDKAADFERFVVGRQYTCWYDPADPGVVVLERGTSWWIWLVLIVPASFIVIGGGGLVYRALRWGKSAERRAAMVQRAQGRDLFGTNGGWDREFPHVPDGGDITNSPGTTLRFRLPIRTSPGWAMFGTLLACVFWNGIVSVFVWIAVRGHIEGEPEWFLTLFIIPFVLVGIALIVFFIRQMLVATGIGPTLVEISEHPLSPGEQYGLFVSQSGRLTVNSLSVLLVCEEEATYRQGTNTRTETREVRRQAVFRREGFEVHRGLPFEVQCELNVPAGVMHSFKADHNEINWKVVVEGDVAGWPDYKHSFPVIIRPADGSSHA